MLLLYDILAPPITARISSVVDPVVMKSVWRH